MSSYSVYSGTSASGNYYKHTEQPSSLYCKKPIVPPDNIVQKAKPREYKETTPPVPESKTKEKEAENRIIQEIRTIADSLKNGLNHQVAKIKEKCNSLDGTSQWTEREMQLLNLASRIVRNRASGYHYTMQVADELDNFAIEESNRSFDGKMFFYED